MNELIYRVTGVTKKGGLREYAISVWAKNAKDAKERALAEWARVSEGKHLFQIEAKRWNGHVGAMLLWAKTGEMTARGNWIEYV